MRKLTNEVIYWTLLKHEAWKIYIAATSKGLCYVGSQDKPFEELAAWGSARYPGGTLGQEDGELQPYAVELIDFLKGVRKSFTFPMDFRGTPFQLAVWNALCEIPYGQTWSYSDVAAHIQKPTSVRAVGTAIGANPILITVPCHRVIGKNGTLTGYRGGLNMKMQLLDLERTSSLVIAP
ncbi:methylated-DNA--[protein]-cysteine S-methyltransferase [Paenibacillus wynnii]|uniref:methylated-DNA--[protein]-cysteine S-methyltransferase n=1 Tax=Paenibacillus wynnii TaxID=268407 RepID=A0A098M4F5_9BACL|nr:methylated-DNA--[protein]-cysteine S-methyltransferase [Paenibacillus wynnii]KGE17434.1 cysteine methyltransferase [Paenibacillus wynnii]